MKVVVHYTSGHERSYENIISMSTEVSNNDGVPCYEITLFNRVSEHIACHEVKSFEVYHRDLEWEHYKGGMRCPKCERVVKMKFDRSTPLIFCPYCGNRNALRGC